MAKIDWIKIKNEYINTNASYRKLAEKYNIAFSTLEKTARKEQWTKLKKQQCDKIATKLRQKTAEKIVRQEVDRLANLISLSDRVSDKINKAIEQVETVFIDGEAVDTGIVDTYKLRQIVQSLKDVRDIVRTSDDETASNGTLGAIIKAVESID